MRGNEQWSKMITTWYPHLRKRNNERQSKRWQDQIVQMALKTWMRLAADRKHWAKVALKQI